MSMMDALIDKCNKQQENEQTTNEREGSLYIQQDIIQAQDRAIIDLSE